MPHLKCGRRLVRFQIEAVQGMVGAEAGRKNEGAVKPLGAMTSRALFQRQPNRKVHERGVEHASR